MILVPEKCSIVKECANERRMERTREPGPPRLPVPSVPAPSPTLAQGAGAPAQRLSACAPDGLPVIPGAVGGQGGDTQVSLGGPLGTRAQERFPCHSGSLGCCTVYSAMAEGQPVGAHRGCPQPSSLSQGPGWQLCSPAGLPHPSLGAHPASSGAPLPGEVGARFPTSWASVSSSMGKGLVPEVPEDLPAGQARAVPWAQRPQGTRRPTGAARACGGVPPLSCLPSGSSTAQLSCA